MFAFGETEFRIVNAPGDGLCGYHCMAKIGADLGIPTSAWLPHMNTREWATDEDFQTFCNVTGVMIEMYETFPGGRCMKTLIVPTGGDETRMVAGGRVLIHDHHYDVLAAP